MDLILRAAMVARVLMAWAVSLAILWGAGLSGMGGLDPDIWMMRLVLACSAPVVIAALALCLIYPRRTDRKPGGMIIVSVVFAAALGVWIDGLFGALCAVIVSLPAVLIFMGSMALLPNRRLGIATA